MGLYLVIGENNSQVNTVRVTGRSVRPIEYNSFIIAYEQDMSFEGWLYADDVNTTNNTDELSAKMLALERALTVPNVKIGLQSTVNGQTQHWLAKEGAIGRVRLKSFAFVDTPLSMVTEVKYTMTVTATYGNVSELRSIVTLDETLSYTGTGGPAVVLAPQAGAKSIYQRVADYTDCTVVQSGKMMSRNAAVLPRPVFIRDGAFQHKLAKDTMSYVMRGTQVLLYVRDYSYTFILPELPRLQDMAYLTGMPQRPSGLWPQLPQKDPLQMPQP